MIRIILLAALLLTGTCLKAQIIEFSQFFASSTYLNPAFAGLESNTSLTFNHKSSVGNNDINAKQLTHVTVVHPIQKLTTYLSQTAGVGVSFVQQKVGYQGLYQTTNMMLTGSYVMNVDAEGKKLLSFGLQGGALQHKIASNNLQFGSQYNPYIGYDSTLPFEVLENYNHITPVFNAGIIYSQTSHHNPVLSFNSFIAGISAHGINNPTDGFANYDEMPVQLKAIFTARRKMQTGHFIHPSAYISWTQQSYQINTGLYVSQYVGNMLGTMIQIGGWYRFQDSFIVLGGVQHNNWKAGLSLDLNSKSINDNPVVVADGFQPTWELSFSYNFSFNAEIVKVTNPLF